MKIYAPVKDINGTYASVNFVNSVGETDDPALIEWFIQNGYKVPIQEPSIPNIPKETIVLEKAVEEAELMGYGEKYPDFESMTPNEIRDWAKENGYGSVIKNNRNKEKLIKLIRG